MFHQRPVADIAADEANARWIEIGHVIKISRIGKLIEVDNAPVGCANDQPNKIAADETAPAGYEYTGQSKTISIAVNFGQARSRADN